MEKIKSQIALIIKRVKNGDNSLKDSVSEDGLQYLVERYADAYEQMGGDYRIGKIEGRDFVNYCKKENL